VNVQCWGSHSIRTKSNAGEDGIFSAQNLQSHRKWLGKRPLALPGMLSSQFSFTAMVIISFPFSEHYSQPSNSISLLVLLLGILYFLMILVQMKLRCWKLS